MSHSGISSSYIAWLYSAHVPLFFVLSGLFFENSLSRRSFVKRKINSLLLPFLIYYIISYIVFYVLLLIVGPDNTMVSKFSGLQDIFTQRLTYNGPLWFLLCLFEVELFFYLLYRVLKMVWIRVAICMCIFAVGVFLGNHGVCLPLRIDAVFVAIPFFYIGIALSRSDAFFKGYEWNVAVILCGLCLSIYWLFPCSIDINEGVYSGNKEPFLWLGCVGLTLSLIFFSMFIKSNRIVNWIGQNSLIIMCTHHLVLRVVNRVVCFTGGGPLRVFVITMLIEVPIILIINKKCPIMNGKYQLLPVSC